MTIQPMKKEMFWLAWCSRCIFVGLSYSSRTLTVFALVIICHKGLSTKTLLLAVKGCGRLTTDRKSAMSNVVHERILLSGVLCWRIVRFRNVCNAAFQTSLFLIWAWSMKLNLGWISLQQLNCFPKVPWAKINVSLGRRNMALKCFWWKFSNLSGA